MLAYEGEPCKGRGGKEDEEEEEGVRCTEGVEGGWTRRLRDMILTLKMF